MKLAKFTWKNGRMVREDDVLSCADVTNDMPSIDSFAALLPTTPNFFALR